MNINVKEDCYKFFLINIIIVMNDYQNLNKIFVYWTLRPDIKAPWTTIVHNNDEFKLKYYKAYVTNAVL